MGLLFGLSANAHSAVLEWSLETIAPTPSTASVSETVGGVTFTITRPGASFSIDDLSSYPIPSTWGNRTLGPFNNVNGFGFVGNFSRTVSNVSIEFGDFLPSDFDALTIEGYSGSGARHQRNKLPSTGPSECKSISMGSVDAKVLKVLGTLRPRRA